jgi:hypothetical protein
MKKQVAILIFVLISLLIGHSVEAAKLFALTVDYDPGTGPETFSAENSSMPKLLDDLLGNVGQFSELDSVENFTASVRFYGLPDTFRLAVDKINPEGLFEVTLSSGITPFIKTFTAVSAEDMQEQIVEWLYLSGSSEASALLKEILIIASTAITDGRPGTMTAKMSDTAFRLFGFYPGTSRTNDMRGATSGAHVGLQVDITQFKFDTAVGPMEGDRTQVGVPLWLHFGSRLSYVGQLEFDYTNIEGTEFYGIGADMGLAYRPVLRTGKDRFGWQITPFFGAHTAGSVDGVTAAVLYQIGINNRFEWRIFKRSLISWISQYTDLGSLTLVVNDYQITADVDQGVWKNGAMLEVPIFSLRSLYGNIFLIDTRFMEEADIDGFQEVGFGLVYRLRKVSLGTGLEWTLAEGFEATRVNFNLAWDL